MQAIRKRTKWKIEKEKYNNQKGKHTLSNLNSSMEMTEKFTMQTFKDSVGLIPDYHNRANTAIRSEPHKSFGFLVHIKLIFTILLFIKGAITLCLKNIISTHLNFKILAMILKKKYHWRLQ